MYSVVLEKVVLSRLEVRIGGRDQQGNGVADQMIDYFHAHKDATTHDILSHKHASCSCL